MREERPNAMINVKEELNCVLSRIVQVLLCVFARHQICT
jgi:hypothetical protein